MPCYLFTYHAYRSWMPDRAEGFVQKGRGIEPPNERLAKAYADAACYPPYHFAADVQRFLIGTALHLCQRRGWRVHGAATEVTHLHLLVSWRDETPWQDVRGKIKNILINKILLMDFVFTIIKRIMFFQNKEKKYQEV